MLGYLQRLVVALERIADATEHHSPYGGTVGFMYKGQTHHIVTCTRYKPDGAYGGLCASCGQPRTAHSIDAVRARV